MKKVTLFMIMIMLGGIAIGQAPEIQWTSVYGGAKDDFGIDLVVAPDGGYLTVGWTESNDGDVIGNHGSADIWIVKSNESGDMEWQKCLGGSSRETAWAVEVTNDGGFIIAGESSSNDGDVTDNKGLSDCWIVKLDSVGDIFWEKNYGGTSFDDASDIVQTIDGGYIVAGQTLSNDGDVSGSHGGWDIWVFKLDAAGEIEWQNCFGGSDMDIAVSIEQTNDGGYIIAGYSRSHDGDLDGNYGSRDYWVVKLKSDGSLENQKNFGGSGYDRGMCIYQTNDGGYILGGFSDSSDGDITHPLGMLDYWVLKLDQSLDIQWQISLGGSQDDVIGGIQIKEDGSGFIISGESKSNDGYISGNHGKSDYWIVEVDTTGNIVWQKLMGGADYEYAMNLKQLEDGGIIICGSSLSNDGDVPENNGFADYWIVRLNSPDAIAETYSENIGFYPNPSKGEITLSNASQIKEIRLYNQMGQIEILIKNLSRTVDFSELSNGVYIIEFVTVNNKIRDKLIIEK